jgi:hypothetical protein
MAKIEASRMPGGGGGAAGRARANSASVAKAVGGKSRAAKAKAISDAQNKLTPRQMVETHQKFQEKMKNVFPAQVINPRSVRVVKGTNGKTNMDKNAVTDIMTQMRKSGDVAKITALRYTGKPKGVIKINTNPRVPIQGKKVVAPKSTNGVRRAAGKKNSTKK